MTPSIADIISKDIDDRIIHGAAVLCGTPREILERQAWGFADAAHQHPMTTQTIVDIASVTKVAATITSLLVLHHRNLIDFDAPFTQYLTDFKPQLQHPIRVRDLANHTSGFGDVPGQAQRLYFDESGRKMIDNVLAIPPPFPPTPTAQYACWNYILLALIVEKISGQTLRDFCHKEIFEPLNMKDSSLGKPVTQDVTRLAQTMGTPQPGLISDFVAARIYAAGACTGNAGMFTTSEDLAKLLVCYLQHGTTPQGTVLFGEDEFNEIKPDRKQQVDGYRRFGWIVYDQSMTQEDFGNALCHSGWSGQTVFLNLKKQRFDIVLTTRCGDYDRARSNRFDIIHLLEKQYETQN